jgi:hypothetical protein
MVHLWYGIGIWLLRMPYPDLFGIACANDAFVAIHLELLGGSTQWNVSLVELERLMIGRWMLLPL